jgi:hypothetical protein
VITQEVDMGIELVEYLPLSDTMTWVKKIQSLIARNIPRTISASSLSNKGYDIKNTAEWAEEFYLAISR